MSAERNLDSALSIKALCSKMRDKEECPLLFLAFDIFSIPEDIFFNMRSRARNLLRAETGFR